MPSSIHFGRRLLPAVERGEIPIERVDDAVQRLLGQQLRFAEILRRRPGPELLACDELSFGHGLTYE